MTDNTGEPLTGTKNGRSTDITIASLTDQQKRRMMDINTGEPSTGTPKRRRTDITEEPSAGSQTDKISDNTEEPLTGTEKEKMGHTCSTSEEIRYNLSDNCHNYAQTADENECKTVIRSKRRKRPRQMFTPDDDYDSKLSRRKQKKPKRFPFSSTAPDRPCDLLPNGTPFCCDLCKSRYIVNRYSKKSLKNRRSKHVPAPQQKRDSVTGKVLTLCNACGNSFDRPKKFKRGVLFTSEEEKNKYIQESKEWAKRLSEKFDLPNAVHLFCPVFKTRKCGCLQKYIGANGEDSESQRRASQLSAMASEARRLSALKCYQPAEDDLDKSLQQQKNDGGNCDQNPEQGLDQNLENSSVGSGKETADQSPEKKVKKTSGIGLGNGHKKSEKFAAFVLSKRQHLKIGLNLCERATQKILCYSNNFLHKRLKTEEKRFRATPIKGKARLGLLPSFDDMAKKRCCVDNCVMMALTHRTLLEEWRRRSRQGQLEARRVIAEMLTPSACARKNCYTFITAVTGCSRTTVVQVNQQMLHTGGDREPPTHGLKKFHENVKKKATEPSPMQKMLSEMQTNILDKQREHLHQLQQQVTEQQEQLQQQQQLQQQLLQQTLSSQQGENQNQNMLLLQQINNQLNMQIQNTQRSLQQTLHNMGLLMGTSKPDSQSGSKTGSNIRNGQSHSYESDIQVSQYTDSIQNQGGLNIVCTPQTTMTTSSVPIRLNNNVVGQQQTGVVGMANSVVGQQMGAVGMTNNTSQLIFSSPTFSLVPQQNNLINQSSQQIIQTPQQIIQPHRQIIQPNQQIIQPSQQIIQPPRQIIQSNQQIIQAQQQIYQSPQQIVLTQQPNYQGNIITSQAEQNMITLQQLPTGEVIQIVNEEKTGMNNALQSGKEVILVDNVNMPAGYHGSQVAEVLSNVQVVEMRMPSSLENVAKLHVTRWHNAPTGVAQNQLSLRNADQNTYPTVATHSYRKMDGNSSNVAGSAESHVTITSSAPFGKGNKLASASQRSNVAGNTTKYSSPPNMTVMTRTTSNMSSATTGMSTVHSTNLPNIVASASTNSTLQSFYTATPLSNINDSSENKCANQQSVSKGISQSNASQNIQSSVHKNSVQSKVSRNQSGNKRFNQSEVNKIMTRSESKSATRLSSQKDSTSATIVNSERNKLKKAEMMKMKKFSTESQSSNEINTLQNDNQSITSQNVSKYVMSSNNVSKTTTSRNVSKSSSSQNVSKPAVSSQNVFEKTRANETGKINTHAGTSGISTPVLTSEYMSFSLPLSDVITMYTNSTSDKQNNLNNDETHLQLSLQINPVQRDGGESIYSSNTLSLGSILIMDQDKDNEQQSLLPKVITDHEKFVPKGQKQKDKRIRKDSYLNFGDGQLVIDEDRATDSPAKRRNVSSESYVSDDDNEVRQILQTLTGKSKNTHNAIDQPDTVTRSMTLPFTPMERSDTLIYGQTQSLERSDTFKLTEEMQRSNTMTISKEMERSDTLKLPGTDSPEILVLPIKISKSKKKRNVKKTLYTQVDDVSRVQGHTKPSVNETVQQHRIPINQSFIKSNSPNNPAIVNSTDPIILSGNMTTIDHTWLQRLVNDIQKNNPK